MNINIVYRLYNIWLRLYKFFKSKKKNKFSLLNIAISYTKFLRQQNKKNWKIKK
jgi:hypothetical protein